MNNERHGLDVHRHHLSISESDKFPLNNYGEVDKLLQGVFE